jgi:surface antigen
MAGAAPPTRPRRWPASVLLLLVVGLFAGPLRPAVAADDYPYASAAADKADQWGFLTRECTSFVAWRMNDANGIVFKNGMQGGSWGNATNWAANAAKLGYLVDGNPVVGAIAQWSANEGGDAGQFGHVAWVQSVASDGTVTVEEYNYLYPHDYDTRSGVKAPRYIHVHDVGVPTSAVDYGSQAFGPDGPSFALAGPAGYWFEGAPAGMRGHMRWAYPHGSTESSSADWTPSLAPGTYEVSAWIPGSYATAHAHYVVTDAAGTTEHVVDQAANARSYAVLGTFAFSSTRPIAVHLSDRGDSPTSGLAVGADAMRFRLVQPAALPSPPTAVTASAGSKTATVTWTPGSPGSSQVTKYTVTATPGGATTTVGGSATSAAMQGLVNGTSYTFTVAATNVFGTSGLSAPSNPVTPAGPPDPPTRVRATAGNLSATVNWTPGADQGSAITGYTITATPGNLTTNVDPGATSAVLQGLANGTSYTFTVTEANKLGTSPASAPSNAVTPAAPPGPPTKLRASSPLTVASSKAEEDLAWERPATNGGAVVVSYTVYRGTAKDKLAPIASVSGGTLSYKDTGLRPSTTYYYAVSATNRIGEGPAATITAMTPGQLGGGLT